MSDLSGLSLLYYRPRSYLNPLKCNTIITNSNLIMDPVMWVSLFQGYWDNWQPNYVPRFSYHQGRIITVAVNPSGKGESNSREDEVRKWINIIIQVQHPNQESVNVESLIERVINSLSS